MFSSVSQAFSLRCFLRHFSKPLTSCDHQPVKFTWPREKVQAESTVMVFIYLCFLVALLQHKPIPSMEYGDVGGCLGDLLL